MKKMLILCLALVAIAAAQAQNLMRVHVHNAAPVDIETAKIDSLHWENSTTLRIFLNDQTTTAYALQNVDSLTWLLPEPAADPLTVGGVTLGSGEQFVINDTLTTVHASDCTVRFSTTVTDTSTPLTIRTATQAPALQATPEDPDTELVDIGRNATTVDVSLDGITTLDGFVEIRIPVSLSAEGNIPGAAWYDPDTGQWEPISYDYDTRTGEVVIYSNHLSIYTGYEVEYEHTRQARLNFIDVPITLDDDIQPGIYDMIEDALADAVDWTDYVVKWSDVINTCGLDIGYAGLKSCGLKIGLLEKYSEQIGKIGTILGTYQIMRAGLSGDHETAGLSTMKMLVGKASGAAADVIGTSVMTAAMCGVAIIDYALNQMWETAWDDRQQLYRTMYEHYYSRSANDGLTHHHMTAPQWYKKFMPIFEKGSTETSDVKEQIDKIVDDYVWEFWTQVDEGDFEIYWANITNLPWSYYGGLSEKTKKDLADWHRAELYATTFPIVFETIGRDLKIKNYNLLKTEMKKWVKTANQIITLQISASNTANTSADLSGYRVRFKDLPTTLTDPQKWETTLGANGQGKILFRFYPYYTEGVQPILEIVSPSGEVLAEQEITIDEGTNNIRIEFKQESSKPDDPDSHFNGISLYHNLNYQGKERNSTLRRIPLLQGNVVRPAACTMNKKTVTATGSQRWVYTSWRSGYREDGSELRDTMWTESKWVFEVKLNHAEDSIISGYIRTEFNYVHQYSSGRQENRAEDSHTFQFKGLPLTSVTYPVPYEDDNSWYQRYRPIGHSFGFDYSTGTLSEFLTEDSHQWVDHSTGENESQTIENLDTGNNWEFWIILTKPDEYVIPYQ